jgi:uncharacterized protein YbcC (UPF0753/DUF2309 family)
VRRWVVLVALPLALAVSGSHVKSQVKLIDPSLSRKVVNGEKLKRLTEENNKLTDQYNEVLREAKAWVNIDPEKLAPIARKIADNREKAAELLEHYFEVDP